MSALTKGLLPAFLLVGFTTQALAQPGFPPSGIAGINGNGALGISGFPGPPTGFSGVSGITGLPPGGIAGISGMPSGIRGIGGFPPSGISGIRGGGITGLSGFSGGGSRFESVWTCGKCRREVARGNHSHPPANCPFCGVRLVNGFGSASTGIAPGTGTMPLTPPITPPTFPNSPATPIGTPPISPLIPATDPANPLLNNVPTTTPGLPPENGPSFPATPDSATNIYLNGVRSAVLVYVPSTGDPNTGSSGSGSVISSQHGYILTNWHVIRRSTGEVEVLFPIWQNGRPVVEPQQYSPEAGLRARVVVSDERSDLAIIKLLEPNRIPSGTRSVRLANESPFAASKVYSIGNPGASDSFWVYTPGEVRNVYTKNWSSSSSDGKKSSNHSAKIIETTSLVSPGDSGGPCFNDRGEQVGVTQGVLVSKEAQGYAYFVDTTEVKNFLSRSSIPYNNSNESLPSGPLPGTGINPSTTNPAPTPNPTSPRTQPSPTKPPSSSSSSNNSSSSNKNETNSSPSSSGSGTKLIVVLVAVVLALGTIGAILYGVNANNAARAKRMRRRYRD